MDQETVEKLNESIDQLNKNIERQTSFKFIVARGLVYGVSIVIGTTILAGIVVALLNDVPVVENVIEEYEISE